jgi:DNA/RNA-binding domain of Phe-tRNA-synthetase-like protein
MIQFSMTEGVARLGINGAYFVIRGMTNAKTTPDFDQFFKGQMELLLPTLHEEDIEQDAILKGFRTLHTLVGVSNRKNVSAPESLLLTALRLGHLPRINMVVDIYNLVSAKTRLAIGAHDVGKIENGVTLKITKGTERFIPLGSLEPRAVPAGSYAYIDGADDVLCYLEVKQVEKTKVTEASRDCFYIVQGNRDAPQQLLKLAAEELIAQTIKWCGGISEMLYKSW